MRRQSSGLLVRRTDVRLRAIPQFPGLDEKLLLSGSETASFTSGVSGWKQVNKLYSRSIVTNEQNACPDCAGWSLKAGLENKLSILEA
jgi:hypothetical protein